jgi:hypothetical protein
MLPEADDTLLVQELFQGLGLWDVYCIRSESGKVQSKVERMDTPDIQESTSK